MYPIYIRMLSLKLYNLHWFLFFDKIVFGNTLFFSLQISDFFGGEFSPFCEKYLKISQIPFFLKRKKHRQKTRKNKKNCQKSSQSSTIWKGAFSTFVFFYILPKLAKYTSGPSPPEQHHKIGKKKTLVCKSDWFCQIFGKIFGIEKYFSDFFLKKMHLTIYVIFPINFEKHKIGQDRTVHPNEHQTLKSLLLCAFTILTVSPDANVF